MPEEPYVFPGVQPFIDEVAGREGLDPDQRGQAKRVWHVSRIQTALGQLAGVPPAARSEVLASVLRIRDSLALALAGVEAAVADAKAGVGLNEPEPEPKKKPKGK